MLSASRRGHVFSPMQDFCQTLVSVESNEIKMKIFIFHFILLSLALILDKLGGTSEVKKKNFVFLFVLLSVCTNFVQK